MRLKILIENEFTFQCPDLRFSKQSHPSLKRCPDSQVPLSTIITLLTTIFHYSITFGSYPSAWKCVFHSKFDRLQIYHSLPSCYYTIQIVFGIILIRISLR